MKNQHRVDRDIHQKTRPVPGQPRVREVVGAYRPVEWGVGGPYVLDDGPKPYESPQMTEPTPYTDGNEHLRMLTGNPRAKIRNGVYASSVSGSAPTKARRRGSEG